MIAGMMFAAMAPTLAGAWEVKSFYPMSVRPAMPEPDQAAAAVERGSGVLSALRSAHQTSAERAWLGPTQPCNSGRSPRPSGAEVMVTADPCRR
jgi:hypothetical protein